MLHDVKWLRVKFSGDNTCGHCGQRFFPGTGTVVTKVTGNDSVTLNFCGDHCANDFYLANLRREGM